MNELLVYVLGFLLNLSIVFIITRFMYYPVNPDKQKVFTFIAFNVVVFFVMSLLTSITISVGVGFGLFSLFALLRYRTDPLPIRDMTYLFITLAIAVLNSIMFTEAMYVQLAIANVGILLVTFLLESGVGFSYLQIKHIKYEKIDLIKPENHDKLLADITERTGIKNIVRFEVHDINFVRDYATIKVYFTEGRK